jgi:hypothetical protein
MMICERFGVLLTRATLTTYQSLKVSNKAVAENIAFID